MPYGPVGVLSILHLLLLSYTQSQHPFDRVTGICDGSMFLFGSLDFLVSMGIHLPEEISQLVDFPSPEGRSLPH